MIFPTVTVEFSTNAILTLSFARCARAIAHYKRQMAEEASNGGQLESLLIGGYSQSQMVRLKVTHEKVMACERRVKNMTQCSLG